MRVWHRWAAAIAIGAVGLASWAGAGRAQAPKTQWVVAIGEEGESLDPPTSMLFTSEIYQQHLFDCLVGIEGEEFKPVGLLAEKWETINPTTWRFHLRKGVKFHNGKALDAEDVKYSFEQYADPKNRRSVFARGIARVEIRNASTVDLITLGTSRSRDPHWSVSSRFSRSYSLSVCSISRRIWSIFWLNSSRRLSTRASERLTSDKSRALSRANNCAVSSLRCRLRSLTAVSIRLSMRASAALSDGVLTSSMIAAMSLRAAAAS